LTVRDLPQGRPAPRQPARVILDSRLRIPPEARVLDRDGASVLVATTSRARPDARRALERGGADVIVADGKDGRVDLRGILAELGRRGIMSLLIEGGAGVHGACFDAGLVDKVVVFVAPVILGGPAPAPVGGVGVETLVQAWRLTSVAVRQVEQDLVVEGYPAAPARAGERGASEGGASARGQQEAKRASCLPGS
jgi:diaminohydroxyphosphoribosylaminopyrimidine deaminase/5-amino-6-(5-phosphoribosylamino)uracil reductase